jgi:hypothetical protein
MISDVTSVLLRDFAHNMQRRITAVERGEAVDQLPGAASAGGFTIGLRALRMALARVFRRFFLPYRPTAS